MLHSVSFKSPLHQMTQTTATCLWNDSAAEAELAYAIDHGAVGATCNPVIAVEVVKKELAVLDAPDQGAGGRALDGDRRGVGVARHRRDVGRARAAMLRPVFETHRGRNGRLSIQTDPRHVPRRPRHSRAGDPL